MTDVSVKAFAKINLSLDITERREDGYHLIRSIMQAIDVCDDISVEAKGKVGLYGGVSVKIEMKGNAGADADAQNDVHAIPSDKGILADAQSDARAVPSGKGILVAAQSDARAVPSGKGTLVAAQNDARAVPSDKGALVVAQSDVYAIPSGKDNIMYRAAIVMAEHFPPSAGNKIRIRIAKRIPVAAGLAGGSSDAAAVMLALAHLWGLDVTLASLLEIGTSVGADVPFCLIANAKLNPHLGFADDAQASSCALAEGIGEILSPLSSVSGTVMLVKPNLSVSTAHIYELWDSNHGTQTGAAGRPGHRAHPDTDALVRALAAGDDREAGNTISPNLASNAEHTRSQGCVETAEKRETTEETGTSEKTEKTEKTEQTALPNLSKYMANVLEPVTAGAYPEVDDMIRCVEERAAADYVLMSGSGPTIIAYFADRAAATPAADRMKQALAEQQIACYVGIAELK
jgi:4-diphosphocytidyl-2-C-methyl-D-erythritol kinase